MRRTLAPRGLWLVLWALSWCAASIAQAADPADAVPDSASVVVRWKAPKATMAKLAEYAEAVQPGFGEAVKGGLPALGQAIGNPELDGVDVEKDSWAIIFAESGEKPAVVFVIPVTDAKAVEDALPDDFEFHVADKLAIFSDNEEAVGKVRERLSGKGKALWSKIDAASKKLFDASDVSVLVHVRQLAEEFETELEQAEPQLNAFLDQINAAMPEAQRSQIGAAFDMYRVLGKGVLQGVQDAHSVTLGITVSKDSIRYEDRLQVEAGTPTAKFLGSFPAGDLSLVSKLPANKPAYFGMKVDMAGMIDWSMNMTKSMLTNTSDEQKAGFDAAVKQMRDLKFGEMAFYFDLDPKAAGALRAGTVSEVTPGERMREISRSMLKSMGKIETAGFTQTMTMESAVDKIGGVEVDRITITQEVDPAADPLGLQKKIRDVLFGEKGMQQLVMYQPKHALQTFGGDIAELQGLVTALNSTPSKDAAVTTARKRLFEKANVVALVDVPRLIANGLKLAIREGVIPTGAEVLDGLNFPPSFIGLAIACEPTAVRGQFEIPVTQAQGIAKHVMLLSSHAGARDRQARDVAP
ncbi:MAG: hypothetical protein AABP62_18220 [Planctomycetota bacterium]